MNEFGGLKSGEEFNKALIECLQWIGEFKEGKENFIMNLQTTLTGYDALIFQIMIRLCDKGSEKIVVQNIVKFGLVDCSNKLFSHILRKHGVNLLGPLIK